MNLSDAAVHALLYRTFCFVALQGFFSEQFRYFANDNARFNVLSGDRISFSCKNIQQVELEHVLIQNENIHV